MNLSECGDIGKVVDKRVISLDSAGDFLKLAADSLASGKTIPLPIALTLASAFYDAAEKAKAGEQKQAIAAIGLATGLQHGSRRPKAPYWEVVSNYSKFIDEGMKDTPAAEKVAKILGIGKSTVDDYWNKYQEQEKKVCRTVEALINKT